MTSNLLIQLLNGLASASSLFLVSAGLSLIFGVTRIVNFAHGSLYMLGAYIAWSLVERIGGGALGYWYAILAAASRLAPTDRPDIGYAICFPSATIVKIVAVQVLLG